ncbi:MAG: hypothetical protein IJ002_03210 [Clostridia bacterium]|nr:hypothetical protein [Clostridia bacterium]MBQ8836501.1 hypothetical protein [Clostridia bacterium]
MSDYTKKEIVMIADATSDACELLDMAYGLLTELQSEYFDNSELDSLVITATYSPNKLRLTVSTIEYLLFRARGELDVFGDPQSPAAQHLLDRARRMQTVIDTYNSQ